MVEMGNLELKVNHVIFWFLKSKEENFLYFKFVTYIWERLLNKNLISYSPQKLTLTEPSYIEVAHL